MKKAVILRCLRSSVVCTGASCFKLLNDKQYGADNYNGTVTKILACFTCNGCNDIIIGTTEDLRKKIERVKKLAPDYVYLTDCTKKKDENGVKQLCPVIKKITAEFTAFDIKVVEDMN